MTTQFSPVTGSFKGQHGEIAVTITSHPDEPTPHMVHLSTDAGKCAHFLISEWARLGAFILRLSHPGSTDDGAAGADHPGPDAPTGDDTPGQLELTEPGNAPVSEPADYVTVTSSSPFLAPDTEQDGENG